MKTFRIVPFLFFIAFTSNAQNVVDKPDFISVSNDSLLGSQLHKVLNKLYNNLLTEASLDGYTYGENKNLIQSTLHKIKDYHNQFKNDSLKKVSHQISNIYPITDNDYKVKIDGILSKPEVPPILLYSIALVVTKDNNSFKFSIPLTYETKFWKTKKIGLITYHYRDSLNIERAKIFDANNKSIANKFKLEPEVLNLYMVYNYQEILNLRGVLYSVNENGLYRDGYGIVDRTIFSVMNNEDFSHDMVHYYSGKVHKRENRNWITEEGLAYLWGNAYYTDFNGEMIDYMKLKTFLKSYILKYPKIDIYNLFENDTQIFQQFAPEVSIRSVIAAVIAEEIEKLKGRDGILKLINTGRKERLKSFLIKTDKLIGLNAANFNKKLKILLEK